MLGGEVRRQLEALLALRFAPDDPIKGRVMTLIQQVYDGASEEEWDEVTERFRTAFSLERGEAGRVLSGNERGVREDSLFRARTGFESLVNDGWFSKYLEWTSEHESPTQFHFGAALTMVAGGLRRRPRIAWEARPLYPNLYSILIGPTGARKGAAIDRAVRLVKQGMGVNVLPSEGTHQGFAAGLRRRLTVTRGRTSDGVIVAPEFSVLMSRDKNKEDLVKWFTDWYDCPDHWERALRGEEDYELKNVCVSMLGGSNMAWLRTMPADAISGGFMPRNLLFEASDKRFWRARPKFDARLEQELVTALHRVVKTAPERIDFDDDAGAYLDNWYENELRLAHDQAASDQVQAWMARKQAHAMKVAVVWQLADGGPRDKVAIEWMEKARRVVDWCDVAVEQVYGALGVTQEGQCADDVRAMLVKLGGRASTKVLVRSLMTKYTASRIAGAITTLKKAGELKMDRNPIEGVVCVMR